MDYCPPNRTLSDIWIDNGFSGCFLLTVTGSILSGLMLFFGIAEMRMYCKFGSPVDEGLKTHSKLYWIQMLSGVILILLPIVQIGLAGFNVTEMLYGYLLFFGVSEFFIWIGSFILIQVERNFDLPTPPPRGHSVFLIVFWGCAFVVDNLMLVNFNGKHWYFIVHNSKDQISLVLFCIKYIFTLLQFLLGIKAPGLPSFEERCDFAYTKMPPVRYYGATGVTEIVLPMDADIDQSIDLLTSELQTGELLHQFCRIPQSTNASLSVAEAAQEELATSDGRNQRGSVGSTTSEESPAEQNKIVWTQVDVSPAPSLPKTVYFVSQTPTASTMESFWQSVWESRSAVIISLQKDFTKSHRYFPNLNECMEADQLLISNIREVKRTSWFFSTKSYMMREFSIIHLNSHRELLVQQFQFNHWSDDLSSGKKTSEFADFVLEVRAEIPIRPGSIVVHSFKECGVTGVYLLVDLSLQCIEANEAVRPMELLKAIRAKRPGLIQTKEQMKFACESILVLHRMIQKGGRLNNRNLEE